MNYLLRRTGQLMYWVSLPLLFVYLRFSTRTRVLVIADDAILLVKGWLGSGEWQLPGGGLHQHESEIDGALREVREETTLKLKPSQLKKIAEGTHKRHGLRYKYVTFVAELDAQDPTTKQHFELIDIAWIALGSIDKQACDPLVTAALAAWRKG